MAKKEEMIVELVTTVTGIINASDNSINPAAFCGSNEVLTDLGNGMWQVSEYGLREVKP